jgi:hypothetical protein
LRAAFALRQIWCISKELTIARHESPLAQVQATIGCAALQLLSRHETPDNLKVICIASDHSPISVALTIFAKNVSVGVCYLQHAPVTKYFPPLDYDLSILFDRASVRAYEASASLNKVAMSSNVILLPPFRDDFAGVRVPKKPYKVGICLSVVSNLGGLRELIGSISNHHDIEEVHLRPHPRCSLDLNPLLESKKAKLSSQSRDPRSFFCAMDLCLVPNSGVAIESLHYGCPTFYVEGIDKVPDDYYGFAAKGIVPRFKIRDLEFERSLIAPFGKDWNDKFREYDETVVASRALFRRQVIRRFLKLLSR